MEKWVKVDRASILKPQREQIAGATVQVTLSPYDIPHTVGSYFKDGKCIIEFRYMDGGEPLEAEVHRGDITVKVGRFSRRLYLIEIDGCQTPRVNLHILHPEVDRVIGDLEGHVKTRRELSNYRLAKEILDKQEKELFLSAS